MDVWLIRKYLVVLWCNNAKQNKRNMKNGTTNVRIQFNPNHSFGWGKLHIQILEKRWGKYFSPIGEITFLKPSEGDYIGLTFEVSSDMPEHFTKMGKLAKFIKENTYFNVQPDELLRVINAEEYGVFNTEFLPKKTEGQHFYKVMVDGVYETFIVAPNEILAEKELSKSKLSNVQLLFERIVKFN